MANGHGGYRRPANPAPVSGPGALSRRTDGRQPVMPLTDAAYGEQKTFHELQTASPLPQASLRGTPPQMAPAGPSIVGLGEPTQQPDVPVTDGAELGPGAGPSAIAGPAPWKQDGTELAKYLPLMLDRAQRDGVPQSFKNLVRRLIASM